MLENIAFYLLKIGHITFILPVAVLGMIVSARHQDRYLKAAACLFWVMIINTVLKLLFKVPLMPHLGHGFAFPSGHMHASCAFYGFLAYEIKKPSVRAVLMLLLALLGSSLIIRHYHDLKDVLGAATFFVTEITLYHQLTRRGGAVVTMLIAIISAVGAMIYLKTLGPVPFHVWLAFWGLAGCLITLALAPNIELKPRALSTAIATLITAGAFLAMMRLFKYLDFKAYYLSEIRAGLAPIIVISIKAATKRFMQRFVKTS